MKSFRNSKVKRCHLRSLSDADEEGVRIGILSDLVLRFQNLLETRFHESQDTEFFADELGVTMSTLNRRVKAELGQTVRQAMNERLAIEARLQLRGGQKTNQAGGVRPGI